MKRSRKKQKRLIERSTKEQIKFKDAMEVLVNFYLYLKDKKKDRWLSAATHRHLKIFFSLLFDYCKRSKDGEYILRNGLYVEYKDEKYILFKKRTRLKYIIISHDKKKKRVLVVPSDYTKQKFSKFKIDDEQLTHFIKIMHLFWETVHAGRVMHFELLSIEDKIETQLEYNTEYDYGEDKRRDAYDEDTMKCLYQGSSDFKREEFKSVSQIKSLCKKIKGDVDDLEIKAPDNTLDWLNELLRITNFCDLYIKKKRVVIPDEVADLTYKLQPYREHSFHNLPLDIKSIVLYLNRMILERTYKNLCPKIRDSMYDLDRMYDEGLDSNKLIKYEHISKENAHDLFDKMVAKSLNERLIQVKNIPFHNETVSGNIEISTDNYKRLNIIAITNFGKILLLGKSKKNDFARLQTFPHDHWVSFREILKGFFVNYQFVLGSFSRVGTCEQCGKLMFKKKSSPDKKIGRKKRIDANKKFCSSKCRIADYKENLTPEKVRCQARHNEFVSRWYFLIEKMEFKETNSESTSKKSSDGDKEKNKYKIDNLKKVTNKDHCLKCSSPREKGDLCLIIKSRNKKLFAILKKRHLSRYFKKSKS